MFILHSMNETDKYEKSIIFNCFNISSIAKSSFDFYCKKEKKNFRFDESFYHSILWKKIQERDKSKFASAANTAILRKINWTL